MDREFYDLYYRNLLNTSGTVVREKMILSRQLVAFRRALSKTVFQSKIWSMIRLF